MKVVSFQFRGRFAHFLRAEATANALSYPLPPRTVLLGAIGAIAGMPKDTVQVELADAKFAVGGPLPDRFWHKANMRKNLPAPLSFEVKKSEKGSSKAEKNTRIPQEWLWKPDFKIWATFPDSIHDSIASRIQERRWHFTPCLGLSEMLAEIEWIAQSDATQLSKDCHEIESVIPMSAGEVDTKLVAERKLAVHRVRMPRTVTTDRVFSHADYLAERDGNSIPVVTADAWQIGNEKVLFL